MGGSSSEPVVNEVRGAAVEAICDMHDSESSLLSRHRCGFATGLSSQNPNLLSNPDASGLSHWEVDNGGNGWDVVETECCRVGARSHSKAFVSSFDWCAKWQVVDLWAKGYSQEYLDSEQPEIYVSDWFAPNPEFGGMYKIHVQLLSMDRRRVIDEYEEGPISLSSGSHHHYRQVSHTFRRYGPGVRFVHFLHKGKDVLFWRGHFGARITNSSVRVKSSEAYEIRAVRRSTSLSLSRSPSNITLWMDLNPLMDEVLLHILSFVSAQDLLLHCRCVSRRWRSLVDTPTLWLLKCKREKRLELLEISRLQLDIPWGLVYIKKPFSRNLLRNPCGQEGMRYWHARNGGHDWSVEDNRIHLDGAEAQTCFVSTYFWCEKWQIIDLLHEGLWQELLDHHKPEICISDWYAGREDCGCEYEISVKLLASDRERVIDEYNLRPPPIPQWNNQHHHQVSHVFRNYSRGVRYVKFFNRGKDTQFWAGHYGARITNSSVTVKIHW
ncbi:F-box only protein 27-like isoform X2 [Pleurodeles waltl]|uniref:F-box only protein 27-like isoform X2 n=1 Tax=Pleurodeles waltl TaxID=8319 RepID=UPI003709C097